MPFTGHPLNDELTSGAAIAQIATTAEAAGFDAVFFTEHPIPSEAWLQTGGHDALDPFVGLATVAAHTSSLRLLTNLTPLPFRNPLLLAKTVATLDRVSGGRLTLGVGTGYLKSEFFALGVDFDERNALFDESIATMRLAWTGESFSVDGLHFSARNSRALPTPMQSPVPIWIGGNSKLSRRRVAEGAQGWMPMPNPREYAKARRSAPLETTEELRGMVGYLRDHAESIGRTDPIDIMYMSFEGGAPGQETWHPQQHRESIDELEREGVTWLACNLDASPSLAGVLENIEQYGSDVLESFASGGTKGTDVL